ncbi:MAG: hypothetical protein OEY80_09955 [Nitrospirota bacterium]|nr:hypothetical protein [Nitrospirota bacterium]
MRYLLTGLLLGIIFSSGTVSAQEPPDAQCQNLANRFSQNPDSLAIQELERLRFCVNRALEHREQNLKGELLKGTIIEPPSLPGSSSDTTVPTPPKNLDIQ